MLQIPNTTFIISLVNKTNPLDILQTTTFKLDDYILITGTNTVSCLIGTDLLPPTVFGSPMVMTPQKIVIDGTLIIDMDYGFNSAVYQPNNEILLNQNATIEVQTGIDLFAYRSLIYKCPEEGQWDRILVEPNSTFNTNNTKISGGGTAIWLENNSQFNSAYTHIFENSIGLSVIDYTTFPTFATIYTPFFIGGGTQFRENDIGISLYKTDPINLDYVRVLNNKTGISMNESNLILSNYSIISENFIGLKASFPNYLVDVSLTDFNDNTIGIASNATELSLIDNDINGSTNGVLIYAANNYHSFIFNNDLYSNLSSIAATSYASRAEIINNRVNSTNIPFSLSGTVPLLQKWYLTLNTLEGLNYGTGVSSISNTITLNNTEDVRIQDNTKIYHSTNSISLTGGQKNYVLYNDDILNSNGNGVGLLTTSSPINYFRCNNIASPTGLQVMNNNIGSQYAGNHLSGSGYNLQYGNSHNPYSISGPQYYTDNTFNHSTISNPKARHYDNFFNISLSLYKVSTTDHLGNPNYLGNPYLPYTTAANPTWFDLDRGTNYVCEKGKEEEEEEQYRESQAADDNIQLIQNDNAAVYGLEVEFDTKLKLMRYLSFLNDHNALSPEQNEWYNSLQGSSFDLFIQAESQLRSVSTLAPETEENLLSIEAGISELANALKGLHFTTFNEETEDFVIDEIVKEQYISVKNDLSDKINAKSAILNEARQVVIEALPSLVEINNAVDLDGTTSMSNLKTINALLYKRLSSDTLNYSEEDKAIIASIANQCIGEGGEAVTQARSMRSEFDFEAHQYDDECLVAQGGEEQRLSDSSVRGYSLSPNPASNYTLLTCPKSEVDQICSLIDLQGNAVKTVTIPAGMEQVRIDLEKIGSGVYYISINSVNISKKLVKIN